MATVLLLSAFCFLLSAFCFLPSAFCFLLSAFCFLLSAFCLLPSARNLLVLHPHRSVLEVLLFPDRDDLLQAIDRVVAGFECDLAMGRGYYYDKARFFYLDAAKTMNDTDAVDWPALVHLTPDLFHRPKRHRFVPFIFEVERPAAFGVVAS